jgi:GTP-binding protein
VLVGRPNVGKSTLFNKITRTRRAIVTPTAGTTRDVMAQPTQWQDWPFTLVDTGGVFGASSDPLHELVVLHGRKAIASADLIVFVVDGRDGPVSGDEEIAQTVRQVGVPVIVAVNKTDDKRARSRAVEFYQFGFEPIIEVAAEHGTGVDDLLDEVARRLEGFKDPGRKLTAAAEGEDTSEISIAIIGRPNVGKSSLVNRLLKEERVMVSEMPGTTRDPIDTLLRWHGRDLRIVDTAGIRRAGKVAKAADVESLSVILARRAIQRADVAVLLLDAIEGPTDQDAAVAGEAERAGCGVIIVGNKWDLMKGKGADATKAFDEQVRRRLKFLEYAPLLHLSAATGDRTPKLLEMIAKVAKARQHRVSTGELNRFLERVTRTHRPVSPGKHAVRVMYAAQTAVAPPTFVLFTNVATTFHFSYERFLLNQLRDEFGFEGSPIRIHIRKRSGAHSVSTEEERPRKFRPRQAPRPTRPKRPRPPRKEG